MTPNILKSNVGGGAGHTPTTQPTNDNTTTTNSSKDSTLFPLSNKMDGDHTAKTMEQGANSAMKGGSDMAEGVHESVKQTPAAGEKTTGQGTSIFSKDGAVGKQFNGMLPEFWSSWVASWVASAAAASWLTCWRYSRWSDWRYRAKQVSQHVPSFTLSLPSHIRPVRGIDANSTADAGIGGPFDKQGMVGKHFNADGSVGSTFQQMAEKNESH